MSSAVDIPVGITFVLRFNAKDVLVHAIQFPVQDVKGPTHA
jgi:hypothetical protein